MLCLYIIGVSYSKIISLVLLYNIKLYLMTHSPLMDILTLCLYLIKSVLKQTADPQTALVC